MKKSVRYKGTEVVYSQVGVGRGVLLLHGFLEERGMWNGIVQQLASDFLVLTIDLLGHGETGCIGYVHSMEEQANAVLAVMKDSGLEKAAVIGHSMGGYVALSLLDLAP